MQKLYSNLYDNKTNKVIREEEYHSSLQGVHHPSMAIDKQLWCKIETWW